MRALVRSQQYRFERSRLGRNGFLRTGRTVIVCAGLAAAAFAGWAAAAGQVGPLLVVLALASLAVLGAALMGVAAMFRVGFLEASAAALRPAVLVLAAGAVVLAGIHVASERWQFPFLIGLLSLWAVLGLRSNPIRAGVIVVTLALPVYGAGWLAAYTSGVGLLTVLLLLLLLVVIALVPGSLLTEMLHRRDIYLLAAFAGVIVASLALASSSPTSISLVKTYLARGLLLPVLLVVALGTMTSSESLRTLFAVRRLLIGVGALGGLLSLLQVGAESGYVVPAGRSAFFVEQFVGERAVGFSEAPGTWAAFLLLPFGLCAARFARSGGILPGAALVLIVLGIALSGLRSGWFAVIVVGLAALAVRGGFRRRLGVLAAVVCAGVLAVQLGNFERFVGAGAAGGFSLGHGRLAPDESLRQRFLLTRAEADLGLRHPITGVGLGQTGPAIAGLAPDYIVDSPDARLIPPGEIEKHNVYAGLFAELGVPGAALFVLLLGAGFWSLVESRRLTSDGEARELAEGLFAALLGSAVIAGFTEVDRQVFLWWLLGVSFALRAVLERAAAVEHR